MCHLYRWSAGVAGSVLAEGGVLVAFRASSGMLLHPCPELSLRFADVVGAAATAYAVNYPGSLLRRESVLRSGAEGGGQAAGWLRYKTQIDRGRRSSQSVEGGSGEGDGDAQ